MKRIFLLAIIISISQFVTVDASAQRYPACDDPQVHELMVNRNKYGFENNFSLILMHQTLIKSGYLFPISVQLEEGVEHLVNFASHPNATKANIIIMDKQKKIVGEKQGGKLGATVRFTPKYTGPYYIVVSQKVKRIEKPCGAISVMAYDESIENEEE